MPWKCSGATPTMVDVAIVDAKALANRRRRAAETAQRQPVRHHHHEIVRGPRHLVRTEKPSGGRSQAKPAEVVARDQLPVDALVARRLADVERHHPERNQAVERPQPIAEVFVFLPRHAGMGARLRPWLDEHQLPRMRHARQRLQHDRLEPGEHHDVDANPDAERHDDDGSQQRHPRNRAESVAGVADEMVEEGQA